MINNFKYLRGSYTSGNPSGNINWITELEVTDIHGTIHRVVRYMDSIDRFLSAFSNYNVFIFTIHIVEYPAIYERNWIHESEYIRLVSNNHNTAIWAVVLPRRN